MGIYIFRDSFDCSDNYIRNYIMEKKKKVIYFTDAYTFFFSFYILLMMVLFVLQIESLVLNYLLVFFAGIYAGNYLGFKNFKIVRHNSKDKSE